MCDKVAKRMLLSLNGVTALIGFAGVVGGIIMEVNMFAIFQSIPVGEFLNCLIIT